MILAIIGGIWGVVGLIAWIFLMWAVNRFRRYKTPITQGLIAVMLVFILLGPFAWFPALVIKAIHETE